MAAFFVSPQMTDCSVTLAVVDPALPVTRTLRMRDIPRTAFCRWCNRYQASCPEALEDRAPRPARVWNPFTEDIRWRAVQLMTCSPQNSAI